MDNIQTIVEQGMCISCGVCAANCPKNCIDFKQEDGMYKPQVSGNCVKCKRCLLVCPSVNMDIDIDPSNIAAYVLGNYQQILKAKIRNKDILSRATSGGVVTGIISRLLAIGKYHTAFVVVGYDYHKQVKTEKIETVQELLQSGGSRYIPVSQEEAVNYICKNPNKRVIIVATSCAVAAVEKSIVLNHLCRENYLLIGLFCDKTMHYGVMDYFDQMPEVRGHGIKELHFRSKEGNQWPGKVRLVLDNKKQILLPSSARKNLKDYFVPERCLYCVDKLNRSADIAVGDNYIKKNADEDGISSVIIRTDAGRKAWDICASLFEWSMDSKEDLLDSQLAQKKEECYAFGCLKGIYTQTEISREMREKYLELMRKRKLGVSKNVYITVSRDIRKQQLITRVKNKIKKVLKK